MDICLLLTVIAKFRKAIISFFVFVCTSVWNNLVPTGRIFVKFDIEFFF